MSTFACDLLEHLWRSCLQMEEPHERQQVAPASLLLGAWALQFQCKLSLSVFDLSCSHCRGFEWAAARSLRRRRRRRGLWIWTLASFRARLRGRGVCSSPLVVRGAKELACVSWLGKVF